MAEKQEKKNDTGQDAKVKYTVKDSVFGDLFHIKKNLRELYLVLHPEDTDITEDALTDVTIRNVIMNGQFNDLGFLCGDRFIIMVECQSVWSLNIIIRAFLYLAETYQKYFEEHDIDLYGSKAVAIPEPELYVLYIGDRKDRPEEITLAKEFFGGKETALDVKIKMLYGDNTDDIIGQYVAFTKIYNEQRKAHGRTTEAILETIRICKDRNLLKEYLESREKEVVDIMSILYDEETIRRIHEVNIRNDERKKANENGIRALVKTCQDFGISISETISRVVSNYEITEQDAGTLVKKFW